MPTILYLPFIQYVRFTFSSLRKIKFLVSFMSSMENKLISQVHQLTIINTSQFYPVSSLGSEALIAFL